MRHLLSTQSTEGVEKGARTMANGNCKSMKSDIEGNILSEVRGASEVRAATAKELKATSTEVL